MLAAEWTDWLITSCQLHGHWLRFESGLNMQELVALVAPVTNLTYIFLAITVSALCNEWLLGVWRVADYRLCVHA